MQSECGHSQIIDFPSTTTNDLALDSRILFCGCTTTNHAKNSANQTKIPDFTKGNHVRTSTVAFYINFKLYQLDCQRICYKITFGFCN